MLCGVTTVLDTPSDAVWDRYTRPGGICLIPWRGLLSWRDLGPRRLCSCAFHAGKAFRGCVSLLLLKNIHKSPVFL